MKNELSNCIGVNYDKQSVIEELCDVINNVHFSLVENNQTIKSAQSSACHTNAFFYLSSLIEAVICVIAYWLFFLLSNSHLIGAITGFFMGLLCSISIRHIKSSRVKSDTVFYSSTIIYKPIIEIVNQIDSFVCSLSKLLSRESEQNPQLELYPLERKPYTSVLWWLYEDMVKLENPDEIEHIIWVFNSCGYGLLEYSPENDDMFEKSPANISQIKTTLKALVNIKTNDCIIRGRAIFPLK